jgi:prepilin-type N-terminal cleavage/methylation domain-containing protein
MKYIKIKKQSGFTLVEMIVALAIFIIVAVVAVGALTKVTGLNRRAQTLQSSMNSLGFALEAMSRELRVGDTYHCKQGALVTQGNPQNLQTNGYGCGINNNPNSNNPGDARVIYFKSSKKFFSTTPDEVCNLVYAYAIVPATVPGEWLMKKAQQSSCYDPIEVNEFYPILDENIHLTGFRLGVFSNDQDRPYSSSFIRLMGYAGKREQDKNFFDIQTAVSQRDYDK